MGMSSLGRRSTLDSDTASSFFTSVLGVPAGANAEGSSEDAPHRPLEAPVACLFWGVLGYQVGAMAQGLWFTSVDDCLSWGVLGYQVGAMAQGLWFTSVDDCLKTFMQRALINFYDLLVDHYSFC
jgi:hypothetical protein